MLARRILGALLLCLVMTAGASAKKLAKEPAVDLSQYDFRSGDIVFQHLPGKLGSVICEVTDSPLSHCGMVVERKGELQVIEAIGPVRYISLKKWLNQGDKGHFTQMRLKEVSQEQIAKAVTAAGTMLGRPYDIQYELDDQKIYCSELVYKAYLRGAEIEVGDKEELGKLHWRGQEEFIRAIAGGDMPLERVMVTPASVARSSRLKLMYSTFPTRKDETVYDQNVLAGKWSGDYTIKSLAPVTAIVEFDSRGIFSSGSIQVADGSQVAIRDFTIEPFKSQREFTGKLRDARGIEGGIRARIQDEGRRIIGTWKDDQGNRGVFSFEKD
jgi:hypothetical protein